MRRGRVAATLAAVLVAGLASRRVDALPAVIEDHAGDVLWATAVVLAIALTCPQWPPVGVGFAAFAVAVMVEISQLWRPDWLEDLLSNDLAALVLGRGFLWSDIPRYAVGCVVGVVCLRALPFSTPRRARP